MTSCETRTRAASTLLLPGTHQGDCACLALSFSCQQPLFHRLSLLRVVILVAQGRALFLQSDASATAAEHSILLIRASSGPTLPQYYRFHKPAARHFCSSFEYLTNIEFQCTRKSCHARRPSRQVHPPWVTANSTSASCCICSEMLYVLTPTRAILASSIMQRHLTSTIAAAIAHDKR